MKGSESLYHLFSLTHSHPTGEIAGIRRPRHSSCPARDSPSPPQTISNSGDPNHRPKQEFGSPTVKRPRSQNFHSPTIATQNRGPIFSFFYLILRSPSSRRRSSMGPRSAAHPCGLPAAAHHAHAAGTSLPRRHPRLPRSRGALPSVLGPVGAPSAASMVPRMGARSCPWSPAWELTRTRPCPCRSSPARAASEAVVDEAARIRGRRFLFALGDGGLWACFFSPSPGHACRAATGATARPGKVRRRTWGGYGRAHGERGKAANGAPPRTRPAGSALPRRHYGPTTTPPLQRFASLFWKTLICVSVGLLCKMRCCFRSSVGERFMVCKTLYTAHFAFRLFCWRWPQTIRTGVRYAFL